MTDFGSPTSGNAEHSRAVTAFFDSKPAADKAKTDLIAAGLSPDAISVAGGDTLTTDAPVDNGGFWHALKEFFMPDEDRYSYAEGLRRGGYALSVWTDEAQYDRALDILDADGAVDIDERERSWKSEGWSGYLPDAASDLGFGSADASTAGFGASRAGADGYASTGSLTERGTPGAESRADADRVGTGPNEEGLLNPDFRERIGSGTASMTPPTSTGPQDATLGNNAATSDRAREATLSPDFRDSVGAGATGGTSTASFTGSSAPQARDTPSYATAADAEDATLGSPTRSGAETPAARSTVGSTMSDTAASRPQDAAGTGLARRDDGVQRARVRGYIADAKTDSAASGI